jgi:hypothetical protein
LPALSVTLGVPATSCIVNVTTMLRPAATPGAGTVTASDVPVVLLCAVPITFSKQIPS